MFAYAAPRDMRKSFNTLSGMVTAMGYELAAGDVFLFVGRVPLSPPAPLLALLRPSGGRWSSLRLSE